MQQTHTVFYSWQSNSDKATNLNGIRNALRSAIGEIELENEELKLILDEATRDEPGGPNIPKTIMGKIRKADIFICDLTTINQSENKKLRTPNPNVLVELGYAIAILGWSRIIMLFNENLGTFPDDLPFDIDRHRASRYSIESKADKTGSKKLTSLLITALNSIIEKDPIKAIDILHDSPEMKRRESDIKNLKWVMSSFDIYSFDNFLDRMPLVILIEMTYYQDAMYSKMRSSSFHIYDKKLYDLLTKFNWQWNKSMSFTEHYFTDRTDTKIIFNVPNDIFPTDKARDDFHYLEKLGIDLRDTYKKLILHIRNNYMELDIEETSTTAREELQKFMQSEF